MHPAEPNLQRVVMSALCLVLVAAEQVPCLSKLLSLVGVRRPDSSILTPERAACIPHQYMTDGQMDQHTDWGLTTQEHALFPGRTTLVQANLS